MDHCKLADVGIDFKVKEDAEDPAKAEADTTELRATLDKYFHAFAKPVRVPKEEANMLYGSLRCLNCETVLSGALGSFQWGIVHGEGRCSKCGWPCRAYHYPKHGDEKIFDKRMEFILQFHPDFVTKAEQPCES